MADHDVVIVGGGPAGCSAGVFTARYGLDTVIFDRGRSSLLLCAHLENYLGFPGGIDAETFYALAHDQAEAAGCDVIDDMVEGVDTTADEKRNGDSRQFVVSTQDGSTVTASRVVAATRYGGAYLRGLDDDDSMFDSHEHDGETHEFFDRTYADDDGRTPVEGLYIAGPVEKRSLQAITAAGHGALVGQHVVGDARREQGYWDDVAERVDWVRRESAREEEHLTREFWRDYFENQRPDGLEMDDDRFRKLREAEVDRRLDVNITDEEMAARTERAHDRLLEHIDTDRIRAYLDRVDERTETAD